MQRPARFNNCLPHNRRDGTFEERTAQAGLLGTAIGYSLGVATGDFDNDGFADVFLCNVGANQLFRNNHDGTFTDVTAGSGLDKPENTISVGAAWFDYDGDGLPDLLVADHTKWTPDTDIRCVDSLKREAGVGQSRGKAMGISIADVTRDGWPDVFVVNDTERNFLLMSQGNGKFREEDIVYGVAFNEDGIAVNGMGSDAKDYNNDGFRVFFYNDLPQQVFSLFLNEGGKSFRFTSPSTAISRFSYRLGGWSAGFIDYDNDGWKDIFSANGDVDYNGDNARQPDSMFRNVAGKSFTDASGSMGAAFNRKGFHRGAAFGDLNNDGSLDIVVTGLNERPRTLMNRGTAGSHWLLLDLTGMHGSRDAVRAGVKVTTALGRALYNHVSVSTGFVRQARAFRTRCGERNCFGRDRGAGGTGADSPQCAGRPDSEDSRTLV